MPYKSISQLPPMVKNSLPAEAQRVYLAAFNSAAEKAPGDEMKCAKIAWAAVKKAFAKDEKGAWVAVEANAAEPPAGHIDLYLSDVTSAVEIVTAESGNLMARGLPVLQVGCWNGRDYSAEDLQELAGNFTAIRDSDAWEPPMRPYHAYDREGRPVSHSASETLGWHKALRYDAATQRLLADVELVDRQTAADMISGKLRYVSSEIARDAYTSPVTGEGYALAYVGGAFVDNPAVKGMPWSVVLNAAEYGHAGGEYEEPLAAEAIDQLDADETAGATGNEAGTPGAKGAVRMGLFDTLKAKFKGYGVPDEALAELDQLAEKPTDPPPPAAPVAATPPPPVTPLADEGLRRQMELLEAAKTASEARIEALEAERRQEKAKHAVEAWTRDGKLAPAKGPAALALVERLSMDAVPVATLADEGTGSRQVSALDLLAEIIDSREPAVSTKPRGNVWQGGDNPDAAAIMSEDELRKVAAFAGGGGK